MRHEIEDGVTCDHINALPPKLRGFIRDLESNSDPSGHVRRIWVLEERCTALEKLVAELLPEAEA